MKNTLIAVTSIALLTGSNLAHAEFGEKVNCQTSTFQVPMYAGQASCHVSGHWIDQYVSPTTQSSTYLTEWINNQNFGCWASVPFSHYATLTSESCDYKPVASVYAYSSSTFTNIITAGGKDFDGSIVENKLWINGVLQSTSTVSRYWPEGTRLIIKAQTKDNDGYTHQTTKTHYVEYSCTEGEIITC